MEPTGCPKKCIAANWMLKSNEASHVYPASISSLPIFAAQKSNMEPTEKTSALLVVHNQNPRITWQ
jgi:hypothetical protein